MGYRKKCVRSTDSGRGADEKISSDKNIRKWAKTRALWRDSDGDVTTTNDAHTSDCCEKSVRTGWPALSGGPEHRRQRVGATHKFSKYQRRRDPRRSRSSEGGWGVLRSDEGVFGESGCEERIGVWRGGNTTTRHVFKIYDTFVHCAPDPTPDPCSRICPPNRLLGAVLTCPSARSAASRFSKFREWILHFSGMKWRFCLFLCVVNIYFQKSDGVSRT